MHRRRLLQSLGSLAVAAAAPGVSGAPSLNLDDPRDRLTALAKMRGSADGRLTIGWVIGERYAVVDHKAIPMLGILAGTFSRYRRLDADTFEAHALEIAYFTDLDTGRLLETWKNPVTGTVVDVPQTRMGPSRILMRAGGLEIPRPSGEATGMAIEHRFLDPVVLGGQVWVTEEIRVASDAPAPGGQDFRYNEMTTYQAKLSDLNDPAIPVAPVNVQFQSLVTFRRWMGFGDTPGHTTARGFGGRAVTPGELPPYYVALTRQFHPDVIADPLAALAAEPG